MLTTLSIDSNDSVIVIHRTEKRRSTAKRQPSSATGKRFASVRGISKTILTILSRTTTTGQKPPRRSSRRDARYGRPEKHGATISREGSSSVSTRGLYDMWKVKRIVVLTICEISRRATQVRIHPSVPRSRFLVIIRRAQCLK